MSEAARALVRAVITPGWKVEGTPAPDPRDLAEAIAELEHPLPLKHSEPGLDGQASRLIEDALRPIGAKLDPRISPDQAKAWRKAMLLALSDLPAPVALKAVRRAVHETVQFFNEVEGVVRKFAAEALNQQRLALFQLKRWQQELERATNQQPRIESPPPKPITPDEIDTMNQMMRRVRSKRRWRLEDGEAVMFLLDEPEPDGESG